MEDHRALSPRACSLRSEEREDRRKGQEPSSPSTERQDDKSEGDFKSLGSGTRELVAEVLPAAREAPEMVGRPLAPPQEKHFLIVCGKGGSVPPPTDRFQAAGSPSCQPGGAGMQCLIRIGGTSSLSGGLRKSQLITCPKAARRGP